MRTTVHLPDELLKRAKRKAAADGTTLTALLEAGLRVVLADKAFDGGRKPARTRLPVSRHSGGLMPGIDPKKIATQTEEIEDIERMQRLEGWK